MNIFEAVKGSITAREAAERYGIKVNHNRFACCPFHDDRIPSMKIDKRYHCFGCQADGDVIDFTARLFNIPARAAALKLARDFNISYSVKEDRLSLLAPASTSALETTETNAPTPKPVPEYESESCEREFPDDMWRCASVLLDYRSLLKRWRLEYAPTDSKEEWHPLFTEALQEEAHVEYLLDVLMNGSRMEVADLIIDEKDKIDGLEERISQYRREGVIQSEL